MLVVLIAVDSFNLKARFCQKVYVCERCKSAVQLSLDSGCNKAFCKLHYVKVIVFKLFCHVRQVARRPKPLTLYPPDPLYRP